MVDKASRKVFGGSNSTAGDGQDELPGAMTLACEELREWWLRRQKWDKFGKKRKLEDQS
jgi:hypothetical protein